MKVRWRKSAIEDLRNIRAWLATFENAKPGRTALRIRQAAAGLERMPWKGPPYRHGTRKLSVPHEPYVIIYRLSESAIDILSVYHTAQNR